MSKTIVYDHCYFPYCSLIFLVQFTIILLTIQALWLASYWTGRVHTFLKHLGLANLPITSSDNFSVPVIIAVCSSYHRYMARGSRVPSCARFYLPGTSRLSQFGWHWKYQQVNSRSSTGNFVPSQSEVMSSVTDRGSLTRQLAKCYSVSCLESFKPTRAAGKCMVPERCCQLLCLQL